MRPLYSVSKHAVVALSENVFLELQQKEAKINVSVLCPGPTDTNIHTSAERTRPADVPPPPEPTEEGEIFKKAHQTWLKRGLDPMVVARRVLTAIQEDQFYIIPYDIRDGIEQRLSHQAKLKNPVAPPPPEEFMAIFEEMMQKLNFQM